MNHFLTRTSEAARRSQVYPLLANNPEYVWVTEMTSAEPVGWLAASLTLLAFSQRSMLPLRLAAIGSNISFITYGMLSTLHPVVALHLLLLPCNLYRIAQLIRERAAARRCSRPQGWCPNEPRASADQNTTYQPVLQPLTAAMLCTEVLIENACTQTERDAARFVSASLAALENELLSEGVRPTRATEVARHNLVGQSKDCFRSVLRRAHPDSDTN